MALWAVTKRHSPLRRIRVLARRRIIPSGCVEDSGHGNAHRPEYIATAARHKSVLGTDCAVQQLWAEWCALAGWDRMQKGYFDGSPAQNAHLEKALPDRVCAGGGHGPGRGRALGSRLCGG